MPRCLRCGSYTKKGNVSTFCKDCYQRHLDIDEWKNEQFGKDEIICPYCGFKISDPYEYGLDDGDYLEIECPECEKTFGVSLEITYTYRSNKRAKDYQGEVIDDAKKRRF